MADKRVKDMRARLSKTMVQNPIYDRYGTGPVYESVKPPQFDTPTLLMLESTNKLATATQQNHGIRSQGLHSFQNKHNMVNKYPNIMLLLIVVTFLT